MARSDTARWFAWTLGLAVFALSGCQLGSRQTLVLNGKSIVFPRINYLSTPSTASLTYSRGDFVIQATDPVRVDDHRISVDGDWVTIDDNQIKVADNYQVITGKNRTIRLALKPAAAMPAPEKPESKVEPATGTPGE